MTFLPRSGVTHTKNNPFSGRNLPSKITFSIHQVSEVLDIGDSDNLLILHDLRLGHKDIGIAVGTKAFDYIISNLSVGCWTGESQDDDIIVPVMLSLRLLQTYSLFLSGTGQMRFCPDNTLHALFRLHPETATAGPARTIMEA